MVYCKSLNYVNDIYGNILLHNGAIEISFESQEDSKAYVLAVNLKMLNHDKNYFVNFLGNVVVKVN